MHRRPFVDRRVVDLEASGRAAVDTADEWGLPPPTLLRQGMNAIYVCGDVILRVGRASAPARASHGLAAMLSSRGIPCVAAVDGLATDRDGFAVSAWERIADSDVPIDWRAVGAAVASVHLIPASDIPGEYPLPSPTSFPWWDFESLVGEVGGHIDAPAMAGLQRTIDTHAAWRDSIDRDAVVCHGDVHPGNVLMTGDGPVLIDWDLLCRAPAGWDHAMLTTYAERWGGHPDVYEAFADGYGASLADDEFTRSIGSLRNVAATLMRVRAGITDHAARAEAERRLQFWRGDPGAPTWQAQ